MRTRHIKWICLGACCIIALWLFLAIRPIHRSRQINVPDMELNATRCRLLTGNGVGYFDWDLYLNNDDFFRKVTGTFVFERNNALLPDFNIAKEKVDVSYPPSTLNREAHGTEDFDCPSDIDYDMNVRFKWSNFRIEGVYDVYLVTDGHATGTVEDFI